MATKKKATRKKPPATKRRSRTKRPPHRPVTITLEQTQALCKLLRMGAYIDTALPHVGLAKSTYYSWLARGRNELDRREKLLKELDDEWHADQERDPKRRIRKEERERRKKRDAEDAKKRASQQVYVDFLDEVDRAIAEGEHAALSVVTRTAAGGAVVATTTTTRADGSTIVTEKRQPPNWGAASWLLERRAPERWGRREAAAVVVTDAGDEAGLGVARQRLAAALVRLGGNGSALPEGVGQPRAEEDDDED